MKKLAFILCVSFLLSCSNSEEFNSKSACGVDNPIENLAWLKSEIEQREQNQIDQTVDWQYHYIMLVAFEKKDIFIYGNCCPNCNSVYVVNNCNGVKIGFIGDEKFSSDLLSTGKLIWKSKNNECDF